MKYLSEFRFIQELIVIFLLLLLINNYLKNDRPVILADGKGYYEYLPAIFIYKDLNFHYTDTLVTDFYNHKISSAGYLPTVNGNRVDKYFVGTAVAQAPFFLAAHFMASHSSEIKADGYSLIYQDFIFYAAIFYLFIGLWFIRKLLEINHSPAFYIFAIQLVVLFGGSMMVYINSLPSFSHVYSFAFVSLFLLCMSKYSQDKKQKQLYLAGFAAGMIILIRPANGLIIFFIPFLFDSWAAFAKSAKTLFTNERHSLIIAVLLGLAVVAIQPVIWYIQTGSFYVKPYQEEGFILSQPNMLKFLFSYKKGFFIYAPAFFILMLLGFIGFGIKKEYWKLFSFLIPILVVIYILSSWWMWYYGASFGSRVMIDYYAVFALFGSSFYRLKVRFAKPLSLIFFVLLIYLAVIQSFQYKHYIFQWDQMNKERFWKVFLKTAPKYEGIFWQKTYDIKADQWILRKTITDQELLNPDLNDMVLIDKILLPEIDNSSQKHLLQFVYQVNFEEGIDRLVVLVEDSAGKKMYSTSKHLFTEFTSNNYEGIAQISLEIDSSKLQHNYLKVYLIKNEENAIMKSLKIKLAKL
ncbi:MAG: hypothetical protein RBR87_15590 [Bacteroidales bacterium]|nr:hypothetical protein [Bacteroidales bacterium]